MIKQVVVGIDGSEHSYTAFNFGQFFAASIGCEIKAVFVLDSRKSELPIIYATGHFDYAFARTYIPPDSELRGFYQKIKSDTAAFATDCLNDLKDRCSKTGIPFIPVQREGLPSTILSEEARSGDVLIVGQKGENARFDRTIVGSTTEDIVRSSPRPILICPKDFSEPKRILFPYDGSTSAERALQFVANAFGSFWQEFVILLAGIGSEDDPSIERELRYFKKHCASCRTVSEAASPVDSILSIADRENSDLILVGSHGRRKIKDYLLGSTTSHLIRKSTLPILIVY